MNDIAFKDIRASSIAFADFARPRTRLPVGTVDYPRAGYSLGQLAMARLWSAGKRADLFVKPTSEMIANAVLLINAERTKNSETPYTVKVNGGHLDVEFVARLMAGPVVSNSDARVVTFYTLGPDGLLVNPSSIKPSKPSVRVVVDGDVIVSAGVV